MNLISADLAKLAACGISPELAAQAQLRRVDSQEGGALIGRNGAADYSGIVFPNIAPGETRPREYRLRRDHPEIEYKDGKPREKNKYLSPPRAANYCYFVPGTDSEWLGDTCLPVVICEGEKKPLAGWTCAWDGLGDTAERPRFLPVGLPGVWNFRDNSGKTNGPDGSRRNVSELTADIRRIAWKGRKVTVAFDTNVHDNPSVQAARLALTKELQRLGAIVSWFAWPDDTPESVNGIDDLVGLWGVERVRHLVLNRARPCKVTATEAKSSAREFVAVEEDHYRLTFPSLGLTLDIDRLRREHHELIGELLVRCELPGAKTVAGDILSIADYNVSSARAGSERAKLLADRANTKDLDWVGIIEELRVHVLQADREGQPGVYLHILPKPDRENDTAEIHGLVLPKRHPSIIYGDGGSLKSYEALYIAGTLANEGIPTALFDWELAGEDHRDRLERLFGDPMPRILYVRCERPLVHELDRLRRMVREKGIEYSVFDSVAYACDGPPEAAEVAGRYFRAVRQIGGGSLHIAHMPKGEGGDQKPFGSVFWWNSARSIWYAERAEETPDGSIVRLGLFHRKINLGALRQPLGYTVIFTEDRTVFRRSEIADNLTLAQKLTVAQRITALLRRGSMTITQIAEDLELEANTVTQTVNRCVKKGRLFIVLDGKDTDRRIGLLGHGRAS